MQYYSNQPAVSGAQGRHAVGFSFCRKFSILAVLCLVLPTAFAWQAGDTITGKVVAIADGDTVTVLTSANEQVKVRLHGIDCPESGQPFGNVAKDYTGEICFGKTARVEVTDIDRYGRVVGNVIVNGSTNVNQALVGAGLAWWYTEYAPNDLTLMRLHTQAVVEKRGLWGGSEVAVAPWDWRRGQTTPEVAGLSTARESSPSYLPRLGTATDTVYVTDSGKRYHSEGCRYLAKSKHSINLGDTAARGYTACTVCKPPTAPMASQQPLRAPPIQTYQNPQPQSQTYSATTPAYQPQAQAQSQPSGAQVFITNTGKKYHAAGCQYLSKSKIPIDKQSAVARGFGACSRCSP